MSRAEDTDILEYARQCGATVLTLDADFHAILASSGATGPSVIRIRKEGLDAAAVFRLVQSVLAWFSEDLESGCMITVKPPKISRHKLPVTGS
jgi:predicted nuclease of predicted toxin-antitoxin system